MMKKILPLLFLAFISRVAFAQNADPGIVITAIPSTIPLGGNGIISAAVGNYGLNTILTGTLRVNIFAGTNAQIIGLAPGSDIRWTVTFLGAGAGNNIRLENTGGGFGPADIGNILINIQGVAIGANDLILSNIGYITANNPALGGAPNTIQGNTSVANNNSQTPLTVALGEICNNALDDDFDGLIDCPDPDCKPSPTITSNSPVCAGTTLNISSTVTSGTPTYNYMWSGPSGFLSSDEDPTRTMVSTVAGGTYTLTVSDSYGCSATGTTNVTVNSVTAAIAAGGPTTFCQGGSVVLTASGGTAFLWSTGATTASVTATTTGDYIVTVTNNGCPASICQHVTVLPLPTPTVTANDATLCLGEVANLSVTGGPFSSYLWTGGATTATITANTAGTFAVTVTNSSGCSATASLPIIVNSLPAPTVVANDASLCAGQVATISISNGPFAAYVWSSGATTATVTANTAGTFVVTVTNSNGCTGTGSVNIIQNPPLVASASSNSPICSGSDIHLTGSAAASYSWTGPGAYTSNIQSPTITASTTAMSGTYNLTVTDSNTCTATASTAVSVVAPMVLNASSESCSLDGLTYTVTLQFSGGQSPYTVSGATGTLSGTTFTSNPIAVNTQTTILVTDNINVCPALSYNTVGTCTPPTVCGVGCFAANLVTNGGFEAGNTAFTSNYVYSDCPLASSPCVNGSNIPIICTYHYGVETSPAFCNPDFSPNIVDHTSGAGNMMIVDFPTNNVVPNNNVWCQTIPVQQNTDYCFGAYFMNLLPSGSNQPLPFFNFTANGLNIGSTNTIAENEQWNFNGINFNTGIVSNVTMCIQNANFGLVGFDLAIDDISLRPVINGNPPIAVDDNLAACTAGGPETINVLVNDSSIDPITSLTILTAPPFSDGTISNVNLTAGTVEFTPFATFDGSTSFEYQICTASGCCASATVFLELRPGVVSSLVGTDTLCAPATGNFTASGGTHYEWFLNGTAVSTNPSVAIYTSPILNNGDIVSVEICNDVIFDGIINESVWGTALATSTGGPTPGFGAGQELNALYVSGDATNLNFAIAGNVQTNNRILLFIDSHSGGYTNGNFGRTGAPQGVDDFNSATTFDTGFQPDYCLAIGTNATQSNFFYDLFTLAGTAAGGGGSNNYLGDNSSLTLHGAPANSSQTQGFEVQIPRASLGYLGGNFQVMAMYSSDGGFLSNQFLTHAGSSDGNYTNGAVTFSAATPNPIVVAEPAVPCCETESITITISPLTANIVETIPVACNGGTAQVTANATGGFAPFTYLWNTGATTASISGVAAGNVSVTITDSFGCSAIGTHTVSQPTVLTVSLTPTDETCNGNLDGSIVSNTSGGFFGYGYLYFWSNAATTADLTGLGVGAYSLTVTDENGCTATASAVINTTINTPPTAQDYTICQAVTAPAGDGLTADCSIFGGTPSATSAIATSTALPASVDAGANAVLNFTVPALPAGAIVTGLSISLSGNNFGANGDDANFSIGLSGGGLGCTSPAAGPAWNISDNLTGTFGLTQAGGTITMDVFDCDNDNAGAEFEVTNATIIVNYLVNTSTGNLTWWDAPTGGTQVGAGSPFLPTGYTSLAAGTHSYYAQCEYNGCQSTRVEAVLTINPNPAPVLTSVAICFGTNGTLTVTGVAGVSYLWSNGATTNSITPTGLTVAGSPYTYIVTTTNTTTGCTGTASGTITVNPNPAPAIASIAVCAGTNATLTVTGVAGVNYLWSNGATTNFITPTGLTVAGSPYTYTVTTTDATTGCTGTASGTITVNPNPAPALTSVAICAGTNGTLTVTGVAGVNYLWSNGATTNFITPTGLTVAGSPYTYTVTTTDATTGCTGTASGTITVNPNPAPALTSVAICAGTNATLTVTGVAGVNYLWSNGATTSSITPTGLTVAGSPYTYTVTTTDATTGCTGTASGTITVNPNPAPAIASIAVCAGTDGTLSVTGVAGVNYLWSNGATTNFITPTGLTVAGSPYTYTVTTTDATTGCTGTASGTITVNPNPAPAIASIAVCAGTNATLTVTGVAGVNYLWSNGATTSSISPAGLTVAGSPYTYTVTTTNATTGCTGTASGTITVNPNPAPAIASIAVCAGTNGTLSVTGVAGVNYLWSTGATTSSITPTALSAVGSPYTYSVTTTDATTGCTGTASGTITVNPNPTPAIPFVAICAGTDGTLSVTGVAGVTYLWSNGATTSSITETGLTVAGSPYTYSVTTTNTTTGCTGTASGTITVNPNPAPAIASAAICTGTNGTLSVTGVAGVTYLWSNGATTSSITETGLTVAGSPYTYSVTTTNTTTGCTGTASGTITVNPNPAPAIANTAVCQGNSATLSVTGVAGVNYLWSNGATTSSITETGLTAVGSPYTYTVTTTDATTGCTGTASGTITVNPNPAPAIASVAICAGTNGTLTVTSVAGVTYLWSNGATTSSITETGLTVAGSPYTYSVTTTDATTGCTGTASGTITVNPNPAPAIASVAICAGTNGTLTVTGVAGVNYLWSTGATTSSITPTGLTVAGSPYTYTVTTTDATTGCTGTASGTITVNPNPAPAIASVAICAGTNGTLTVTGVAGVNYLWSTGATTASITPTGLTVAGSPYTYTVTTTDATTGCTGTASGTITVNPNPVPAITSVAICAGTNGILTVTGVAGVNYLWSNGATTASITETGLTVAGSLYTYTVTTTNATTGCTGTASGTITVNPNPTPAIANATVCQGNSATLSVTGVVGVNYLWSTGATTSFITPAGLTAAGSPFTYTVTTTDAVTGCTATASGTITVNSNPAPAIASVAICAGTNGTLSVTGVAGVTYLWSNGATTASITENGLTVAGSPYTYTVTTTDATTGCTGTASGTITVNPNPAPAIANTTVCQGSSATLTLTGVVGVNYLWSNGATTSSVTINGLTAAGSPYIYTVTTTDATTGCTGTASGTITVNPNPAPAIASVAICAGTNGTLTVTGVAGVNYLWSNGATTSSITETGLTITGSPYTYTVTTTDAITGCTATASGVITVNPNPAPVIANVAICQGSNAVLTVTGVAGVNYLWSTGATTSAITLNNLTVAGSPYTYAVTTTNSTTGCSATASGTITVNPLPTPSIASVSICQGNSATLTVTGVAGANYLWTNGATTSSITVNNLTAAGSPYTYTVTTTNSTTGCSATATGTITVNPNPAPVVANTTICQGNNATLAVTGVAGVNYLWSNGATTASITETGLTAAGSPYTYTVTTTNTATGCSATASGLVIVNPNPAPVVAPVVVCQGNSATLSVTGVVGVNYLWSTAATTSSITESGLTASGSPYTYTVTVTNSTTGCSATANGTVTINANPAPTIANTIICEGADATLSVSGVAGVSYSWSNAATTSSITEIGLTTVGSPYIYYVTVTDAATGCTATAGASISVNPTPATSAGTDQTICLGTSATITASATGGFSMTYSWDNGLGNGASHTVSPTATTTYQVTATNNFGCSSTSSVNVIINTLPSVNAGLDASICRGASTVLSATASGGSGSSYTFTWDNGLGNGFTHTVSPIATTTYTVSISDGNGCTAVDAVQISVNSNPIANAGSPATICVGGFVTLTATATSGTTPYTYTWDNGVPNNGATVSPTVTTTYTVTVSDFNGCTSTANTLVTVNPLPTPVITPNGPTTFCAGGSVILTASGGGTYHWSTGQNIAAINVADSGTYSVTVTSPAGCSAETNVTVTETTPVTSTFINVTAPLCGGQPGSATVVPAGGTQGYTYIWDSGAVSATASLTGGAHYVTVTDAIGCTNINFVFIPIVSTLNVATNFTYVSCFGGSDGSASALANGGVFPYSYSWEFNGNTIANTPSVTNLVAGTYTVFVTDANGCQGDAAVLINQPSVLDMTLSSTQNALCFGEANGGGEVTINGGTPGYNVFWSNGETGTKVSDLIAGNYSVIAVDAKGCRDTLPFTITEPQDLVMTPAETPAGCFGETNGEILITASGGTGVYQTSIDNGNTFNENQFLYSGLAAGNYNVILTDENGCTVDDIAFIDQHAEISIVADATPPVIDLGDSTQLVVTFVSPVSSPTIAWTPTEFLSCSDCANPMAYPLESTFYVVYVSDPSGCSDSAQVLVRVKPVRNIFIPSAFTPNGDGTNDIFTVYSGTGVEAIEDMLVFDRWGNLLYETHDIPVNNSTNTTFGWDGTFKGKVMNPAVFVYYIKVRFIDGESLPYKGDITLIK